jgi:hypothetical protein
LRLICYIDYPSLAQDAMARWYLQPVPSSIKTKFTPNRKGTRTSFATNKTSASPLKNKQIRRLLNPMLTLSLSRKGNKGRYNEERSFFNLSLSLPLGFDPDLAVEDGQELSERLGASGVDILFGSEQLEGLLQLLVRSREFGVGSLETLVFSGEFGELDFQIPGVLLFSLAESPLGGTILSSSSSACCVCLLGSRADWHCHGGTWAVEWALIRRSEVGRGEWHAERVEAQVVRNRAEWRLI